MVPVAITGRDGYARWEAANVVRGVAKGTVSAYAWAKLGDITSEQFRALASIQRELGAEVRVTNRQNFVFRALSENQLRTLYSRLDAIGPKNQPPTSESKIGRGMTSTKARLSARVSSSRPSPRLLWKSNSVAWRSAAVRRMR